MFGVGALSRQPITDQFLLKPTTMVDSVAAGIEDSVGQGTTVLAKIEQAATSSEA